MKNLTKFFSQLHPLRVLLSIFFAVILIFSNSVPALAAKTSSLTKGTVQLDKIEQKTQEAIDSPTTSLKEIEKKVKGESMKYKVLPIAKK
jgi:cell division protein FtsL